MEEREARRLYMSRVFVFGKGVVVEAAGLAKRVIDKDQVATVPRTKRKIAFLFTRYLARRSLSY